MNTKQVVRYTALIGVASAAINGGEVFVLTGCSEFAFECGHRLQPPVKRMINRSCSS